MAALSARDALTTASLRRIFADETDAFDEFVANHKRLDLDYLNDCADGTCRAARRQADDVLAVLEGAGYEAAVKPAPRPVEELVGVLTDPDWETEIEPEPTPEQALRAHVADLLNDVDHLTGCHRYVEGDGTCTCLVGRLAAVIEVSSNPTWAAIDTIARHIIAVLVESQDFGGEWWENIPEIGENDFDLIIARIRTLVEHNPTTAEFDAAYKHLIAIREAEQGHPIGGDAA